MITQEELIPLDPNWPEDARRGYLQLSEVIKTLGTQLTAQAAQLKAQAAQLTAQHLEIEELKQKLNKTSRNSHKPPSSDPPSRKPKAPPKAGGKRKGGQKSHPGARRELLEPTETIQRGPASGCPCGGEWVKEGEQELFQVIDLPPKLTPDVTNFLISTHRCSGCKATHRLGYQPTLRYSPYGPRLHAFVCELSTRYRMSVRQIQALLAQSFSMEVSTGAISGMLKRSVEVCQASYDELLSWFKRDREPKHVDETSWKVAGKLGALIGAHNKRAALFGVSQRRRREDVEALIGEDHGAKIITDRAPVYGRWAGRQLCWSHLLRDFVSLSERPSSAAQGRRLVESARALFQLNRAFLARELSEGAYVQQATALRGRVFHALTKLSTLKQLANSSVSFVRSLLRSEQQMWSFLQDPSLPIHNNAQERELRSAVIKRRLSFGSDTQEGGQGFAVLLSLMRTLKLRALLWSEWFVSLCAGRGASLVP